MTGEAYRAKQALSQYIQLEKSVQERTERLARLMASATRATSSIEAERTSGTGERSRVESVMIRKIDLERQLDRSIDERNAKRYAIQNAIDALEDEREARLLSLRYIDGRGWGYIMRKMEISERMSFYLHETALQHFAEVYFRGR